MKADHCFSDHMFHQQVPEHVLEHLHRSLISIAGHWRRQQRPDFKNDMKTYMKVDDRPSGHTNHQQVPEQLPSDANKA